MGMKIFKKIKERFKSDLISKGKTFVVNNQEVVIIAKVNKASLPAISFVAATNSGQRIIVHNSDVFCPVRLTTKVVHHAPKHRLYA